MKILIVFILLTLITACQIAEENKDPCFKEKQQNKSNYELAQCYQEAAIKAKDATLCNAIAKEEKVTEENTEIFSRGTCRNMVAYKIAKITNDRTYCERINIDVILNNNGTNSEALKEDCREYEI
ncbi:hypothetical protein C4573_05735 [Candidatus Woesearchaeota archaeon]|nr:MAG: hypothetical protein C4573_05735 [Candidatus Woesearchaeota archaeon]